MKNIRSLALTFLFSLSFVLTSCLDGDSDSSGGGGSSSVISSELQGSWERTDLSNGNCESLSLTNGGAGPDSQDAFYQVSSNTIMYNWVKYSGNTTCAIAGGYWDSILMDVTSITDDNGTTKVTAKVTNLQRKAISSVGTTFLNVGGGACGVGAWVQGSTYQYGAGGFVCAGSDRDFTFSSSSVGDVLYFTLKKNGAQLDLQLSDNQASMGTVQNLDSK